LSPDSEICLCFEIWALPRGTAEEAGKFQDYHDAGVDTCRVERCVNMLLQFIRSVVFDVQ